MIDEKYLSKIEEFHDGDWIVWVGGKERHDHWNQEGYMDFILDGKPHKVNIGDGASASFFDSPDKDHKWNWQFTIRSMRKVDAKAILKGLME